MVGVGFYFGELNYLKNTKNPGLVMACSEVVVATLTDKYLKCVFISEPSIAGRFYSNLSLILIHKIHDLMIRMKRELVQPLQKDVPSRVLSTYINIIMKFGPIKTKRSNKNLLNNQNQNVSPSASPDKRKLRLNPSSPMKDKHVLLSDRALVSPDRNPSPSPMRTRTSRREKERQLPVINNE